MKVAISGGSGFIGQYLCDELVNCSFEPIILTRTKKDNSKYKEIETDYSISDLLVKMRGIDAVVHLASKRGSQGQIEEFHENEILTQKIFDVCAELSIKNIVNASTISVYGTLSELPWNESDTINPSLMYGVSKFTNECIANIYAQQKDLSIKNLRIAHVFGFNEKNNYMINKFMRLAYNKKELVIDAPATAKREFIYAKDVARAIRMALNYDSPGTFNIGSKINITNEEVATTINEVFENKNNFVIKNPRGKELISESYMSTEYTKRILGFESKYSFEDALEEIYFQMKELKDVPELY